MNYYHQHNALPEAIDGGAWIHKPDGGMGRVDLVNRTFTAPIDDSPESRFVRLHELAHTALTPSQAPDRLAKKHGVSIDALQVCEDARIQRHLSRRFRTSQMSALTSPELAEMVSSTLRYNQRAKLMLLAVAALHTRTHNELAALRNHPDGAPFNADELRQITRAVDVSKKINTELDTRTGKPLFRHTIAAARRLDSFLGVAAAEESAPVSRDGDEGESEEFISAPRTSRRSAVDTDESGTMTIKRAPLTKTAGRNKAGNTPRASDSGAIPRHMHRYATDGRIFGIKRPAAGGTILIDASGSMELPSEEIAALLDIAPAATVAMYSGHAESGFLTIIGERGKIAAPLAIDQARDLAGFGNIIDLPALEWLAKQPAPRLWVCDGVVTGVHDQTASEVLENHCRVAAIRGRIRRVRTLAAAAQALKERRYA